MGMAAGDIRPWTMSWNGRKNARGSSTEIVGEPVNNGSNGATGRKVSCGLSRRNETGLTYRPIDFRLLAATTIPEAK